MNQTIALDIKNLRRNLSIVERNIVKWVRLYEKKGLSVMYEKGARRKKLNFFFLSKLYVPLECTHSMRTHVLKAKFGNVSEVCVPQECTHSIVTHRCL